MSHLFWVSPLARHDPLARDDPKAYLVRRISAVVPQTATRNAKKKEAICLFLRLRQILCTLLLLASHVSVW
jgi:hypothetical protein